MLNVSVSILCGVLDLETTRAEPNRLCSCSFDNYSPILKGKIMSGPPLRLWSDKNESRGVSIFACCIPVDPIRRGTAQSDIVGSRGKAANDRI